MLEFIAPTGIPTWMDDAACLGAPSEIFFPNVERPQGEHVERARQICAACPVVDECRAYVLEIDEIHGFWGGLSEGERRQIMRPDGRKNNGRRKKPIRHGTRNGYMARRRGEDACPACLEALALEEQHSRPSRAGERRAS